MVVGAVGRLVAENGYPELLEGFRLAQAQCPELRLVVVGPHDPDKADALDQEVVHRAPTDGVQFLGMRDDVEALYRAFGLYVLASHRQASPARRWRRRPWDCRCSPPRLPRGRRPGVLLVAPRSW